MPSTPMARRFYALLGSGYHPSFPSNAAPITDDIPFYVLNLAGDADAIEEGYYDLIIVGRGLADAGAALFSTLDALVAALAPGGSLLFGGDVVGDDGMIAEPALDQLVQGSGARRSFASIVRSKFGRTCRVRVGEDIDVAYVEAMGVAPAKMRRVSQDLLFWYQA